MDKKEQEKLITEIMDADAKDGLYDVPPLLESATFSFSQEGNCVDIDDAEFLEIRCESSLGIDRDGGCFFVLKTEQWTIEDINDLQKIINRISKVVNK